MKSERRLADLQAQLRALKPRSTEAPTRVAFAEALGLDLDPWQRRVLEADSRRDILNCSRQAGKSTTAAILALYEALFVPSSVTVLVSPTQRQSSELFRKVTDLRHLLLEPPGLLEDNKLSMQVNDGGRVLSLPGSEGTIRGISAVTLLVEDEAARVPDELYLAVRPMLAVKNGRLLLMSTPFGKRGHFWDVWDQAEGWHRVRVPATDIPRIASEFLEEERRSMPERIFRQEYLCEFEEASDAVFSYDDVMGALSDDVLPLFGG
jgi:hypothetical protein